jgi:hypothetical protein
VTAKNQHPHPYRNFANFSDAPITMGGIEIIGAIDDHAETVADAIDRQTAAIKDLTKAVRGLINVQAKATDFIDPSSAAVIKYDDIESHEFEHDFERRMRAEREAADHG